MNIKKVLSLSTLLSFSLSAFFASTLNAKTKVVQLNADAPIDYYSSIKDNMYDTALLDKLNSIIDTSSVDVDYDWSRYYAADEDPDNENNVILIYARYSSPKRNSGGGTTNWNREHTFPQSKISSSKAKKDNHIVYASDCKVNGARSNIKMGVVETGSFVKDMYGRDTTCIKNANFFDPHNEARGIVARSTMYAAAMYGFNPLDNFESIETMLRWHQEYLPSSNDMRRNDVVYSNQHNRNPFVDHPEYACRVWGNTNAATKEICSSTFKGVKLSDSTINLEEEETSLLTATSSDGSVITWTNNNPDAISINNSSSSSGEAITITAISSGSATLTASATIDNELFSASCVVTVTSKQVPELSSISLSGNYKSEYELGEEFSSEGLIVTANYTNGDSKILKSDEYDLVEPDMSSIGTKTVTISYEEDEISKSASYSINVIEPSPIIHVQSITLNKNSLELIVKQQFQLEATVLPANADNKEIVWTSSDESIVTVSHLGLVTALKKGETIITVTTVDGGLTAKCSVKVIEFTPSTGGCGGSVGITSVILSTLSVLGIGLLLIKRKFSK